MKLSARQKYEYRDLDRGEAQLIRVGHALWRDPRKLGDTVAEREGIDGAGRSSMKQKPKQKRKRSARKLTRRESALLDRIRAGMTITKAASEVGYSSKWPGQAGSQAYKNIQRKMPTLLDELRLTYKSMLEELEDSKNI